MKRPSYVKPQTLDDWRQYRLSDLLDFFAVPENERAVIQWGYDTYGCGTTLNTKIGNEWYSQSVQFRRRYEIHKHRGHFAKTVPELEAARLADIDREKQGGGR